MLPFAKKYVLLAVVVLVIVSSCLSLVPRRMVAWPRCSPTVETIFVSVASYRDEECSSTLHQIYSKADNPCRVFVGICEQNAPGAEEENCKDVRRWEGNIRRVKFDFREAKGPTYARWWAAMLYKNEDVFLQVDSHTKFVKGWDTKVINMLRRAPSQKPVISTYPNEYSQYGDQEAGLPVMCKSKFNDDGLLSFEAVLKPKDHKMQKIPFCSAGFLLMPGKALLEVPFDKNLVHLFVGEEILYSARLWTSGYDFFSPDEHIAYHHYVRHDKPKFWGDIPDYKDAQRETNEKVRRLLNGEEVPGLLGMGKERTLAAYWEYVGVDWKNKVSNSAAKFC